MHLTEYAKEEWRRVAPMLYALRLLSHADVAALAAYCDAYGTWRQARESMAKMAAGDLLTAGLMIKTSGGNAIQNPLLGIANSAAASMVRHAAEFGMTPVARARIHIGNPENPKGEGEGQGQARPKTTREKYFQ